MKRIATVFNSVAVPILLTLSILLAIGVKNYNNLLPSVQSAPSSLRADGDPAPPFPPPKPPSLIRTGESTLIADGDPVPPFPCPNWPFCPKQPGTIQMNESVLVADGDPPPPFPPRPPSLVS